MQEKRVIIFINSTITIEIVKDSASRDPILQQSSVRLLGLFFIIIYSVQHFWEHERVNWYELWIR